jgi:hypothetical protein
MADPAPQLPARPASPIAPAPPIPQPTAAPDAAANPTPAVPARHPRAPRARAPPSNANVTGVPEMYMLVAPTPASTIQRLALNTFVPSFLACAQVILQMNHMMGTTHRFLQGAHEWCPFLSLAYFGNLFILQALRAYREIRPLPMHESWLLEGIETSIGLDSLIVPGPLVPFFQALAASSAPFEWFGNIGPNVTGFLTGCNQSNDYLVQDGHSRILPNIPFYLDMISKIVAIDADSTPVQRRSLLQRFYSDIMTVNVTDTPNEHFHMSAPGLPSRPFQTPDFIQFVLGLANLDLPSRLNRNGNDATNLNLSQFMRLYDAPTVANGQYHTWFEQAAGVHARYGQFFKGSVPLSSISPSGIGAAITRVRYTAGNARLLAPYTFHAVVAPAPPAAGVPAYYDRNEINSLSAVLEHPDHALEEIAEQCGQLAQVNVDLESSLGAATPTNANLRTGDVWTLPDIRRTSTYDIAPGIFARLASSYYEDTRNTN